MDIKPLLDLTCATVASMIKGKTVSNYIMESALLASVLLTLTLFLYSQPEEIRTTFNITNDFTPEEEAQVREENKWCEEA